MRPAPLSLRPASLGLRPVPRSLPASLTAPLCACISRYPKFQPLHHPAASTSLPLRHARYWYRRAVLWIREVLGFVLFVRRRYILDRGGFLNHYGPSPHPRRVNSATPLYPVNRPTPWRAMSIAEPFRVDRLRTRRPFPPLPSPPPRTQVIDAIRRRILRSKLAPCARMLRTAGTLVWRLLIAPHALLVLPDANMSIAKRCRSRPLVSAMSLRPSSSKPTSTPVLRAVIRIVHRHGPTGSASRPRLAHRFGVAPAVLRSGQSFLRAP